MRDFIGRQMCKQSNLPQNSRAVSALFAGVNFLMMMSLKSEAVATGMSAEPSITNGNTLHRAPSQTPSHPAGDVASASLGGVRRLAEPPSDENIGREAAAERQGQKREEARELMAQSGSGVPLVASASDASGADAEVDSAVRQVEAVMMRVKDELESKLDATAAAQRRQQSELEARLSSQLDVILQRLTAFEHAAPQANAAVAAAAANAPMAGGDGEGRIARAVPLANAVPLPRERQGNRVIIGGHRPWASAVEGGGGAGPSGYELQGMGQRRDSRGGREEGEGSSEAWIARASPEQLQRSAPLADGGAEGSGLRGVAAGEGVAGDEGPAAALRRYNTVVQQAGGRGAGGLGRDESHTSLYQQVRP